MVAILHDIRSVHNVGSIFRTADAAGVEKLYLCGVTPGPLDRLGKKRNDFSKVSLGAEDSVAWEKCLDIVALLDRLRRQGYTIISLEQSRESVPYSSDFSIGKDVALVVGNEVNGLPGEILSASDIVIEIPVHGAFLKDPSHPRNHPRGTAGKESLNVSVSFGIAAYRLGHGHKKGGI